MKQTEHKLNALLYNALKKKHFDILGGYSLSFQELDEEIDTIVACPLNMKLEPTA